MSPSTSTSEFVRPDVAGYVEEVRRHLADLSIDERDELTGGLEADLTERLQESPGSGDPKSVLGDPGRYAAELRAAAGLGASTVGRGAVWGAARERLQSWTSATGWPQSTVAWDFLVQLRPVWWVLRAWIAVEALDYWFGSWPRDWIPSLLGQPVGALLLLGAIVASVQIGRGQWWPGTRSTGWPWYLLAAANLFAVLMAPAIMSDLPRSSDVYQASWVSRSSYYRPSPQGLRLDGQTVHNIYAYDTQGHALVGVQLYDQDGDPLEASGSAQRRGRDYVVTYPWGLSQASDGLGNVYPLATRLQPGRGIDTDAFVGTDPPTVAAPPLVQVPAVAELPAAALEVFYAATGTAPPEDTSTDESPGADPGTVTPPPAEQGTDNPPRNGTGTDEPPRGDTKMRHREKSGAPQRPDGSGTSGDAGRTGKPGR